MRRREFITLLGGAAAGWPLSAGAQQREQTRRMGMLFGLAPNDSVMLTRVAAFHQTLQQLGWADGHNSRLDVRWTAGSIDDLRKYAAELVALAPDVILANGSAALTLLLQATRIVRSPMFPIRSAQASWTPCRGPVATPRALCCSSTA